MSKKRSDFGEVNRRDPNGEVNRSDFNVENRSNWEVVKSNLTGFYGYQRSNFGGVQQLNSHHGNTGNYANQNWEVGAQNGSSISHGVDCNASFTENHMKYGEFYSNPDTAKGYQNGPGVNGGGFNEFNAENYQRNSGAVQRPNDGEFHTEKLRNFAEPQQNLSVQAAQHRSNAFYGYNGNGTGEFQQSPNAQLGNNNFYGNNRENPQPLQQQSQYPLVDGNKVNIEFGSDESLKTDESTGYKGSLAELDECFKEGKIEEAVEVLDLLRKNGVAVDLPRYLTLLQVCGEAKSLEKAKDVHNHINQTMGGVTVAVNNKILDVYSKCGSMTDASQLFEYMHQRNLTSWDIMINGFANNNLGEEAIDLFTMFKEMGSQPDADLFVAVFNACGVLGAVDEGMLHFQSMKRDFGIVPTMKHYCSIVEMLGANGYLDEALEFIEKMPVEPSVDVWETLMNLCRVNGYEELGKRCTEIVEQLDPSRVTELTKMGLLPTKVSNAVVNMKDNSDLLNSKRCRREMKAGDRSHPDSDKIYEQLYALVPNMREAGYVPQTRFALHDLDQESRAEALLAHSEKLAAAYVLMTSPPRSDIRIIKNLRFCNDCHEAMKIISKLTGRFIICRDAKRFHHFRDGFCSCKDYY